MSTSLKITYLFESTELWGGVKVGLEQAEALSDAGHDIVIMSKDSGPSWWYPLKLPFRQAESFNASTIPESDIIVGTYWPTVKDAFESEKGMTVHFCQGYEGGNKELQALKEQIDAVYSLPVPKLTVSPHLDIFLRERFHSETFFVGQMLNREIFFPSKDLNEEKYFEQFKILVIGPFEADVKNIPTALRGIAFARERIKAPITLIRVSQFHVTSEEEEIIKPDFYHFSVPYRSMGEIYRGADLVISMSKQAEGFGLPPLEAMACGIPVIMSEIPSHLTYDIPQDYALFVDALDPAALAGAIEEVFNNNLLRKKLISRGLEVAGLFTKEKVLLRLQKAFEEILGTLH